MITILVIAVIGIAVYLYYKHLDESTVTVENAFNLANEYHDNGDYVQAIHQYTKGLESAPRHYQLWNNRGEVKYQLGRFTEALADFQKSVEFEPSRSINVRAYGNIEKCLHMISKLN
ncbi:tetratricopeptide repeat protein [Dyadobacter crusticola]|uniref:tetratricopeptide repeat protein n=1 Tax=Dyadobacter crusticola TaxID=292407 RepID=UPI0004E184DF